MVLSPRALHFQAFFLVVLAFSVQLLANKSIVTR
uniref:Uncharacterized protein n=1 Tax=Arundo donax TaxID=35708 RepID=A0A0A9HCV9_ARUDO